MVCPRSADLAPPSISAWVTQLRSVSGLIPSCLPIRANAPGRVAGSCRASTAIRVARSRSSSGYFLAAAIALILQWVESLHQTRGGTLHLGAGGRRHCPLGLEEP